MKHLLRALILVSSFLVFAATAQAADFVEIPVAGQYELDAQIDPAETEQLARLCVDRVDVAPVVQIHCLPAGTALTPGSIHTFLVTVSATTGDDGELRAYVEDPSGNRSPYSADAALVDFTAPLAPILLGVRDWMLDELTA